jgi:hypothetical protein
VINAVVEITHNPIVYELDLGVKIAHTQHCRRVIRPESDSVRALCQFVSSNLSVGDLGSDNSVGSQLNRSYCGVCELGAVIVASRIWVPVIVFAVIWVPGMDPIRSAGTSPALRESLEYGIEPASLVAITHGIRGEAVKGDGPSRDF